MVPFVPVDPKYTSFRMILIWLCMLNLASSLQVPLPAIIRSPEGVASPSSLAGSNQPCEKVGIKNFLVTMLWNGFMQF